MCFHCILRRLPHNTFDFVKEFFFHESTQFPILVWNNQVSLLTFVSEFSIIIFSLVYIFVFSMHLFDCSLCCMRHIMWMWIIIHSYRKHNNMHCVHFIVAFMRKLPEIIESNYNDSSFVLFIFWFQLLLWNWIVFSVLRIIDSMIY